MREQVKPGLGRRLVGLIYNNRNDGPPDLDELWRDFNKKLSGLFGGKGLNRYGPDGRLLETLTLPCANVTKATFGGSDLKSFYITTAWKGLKPEQRRQQPLAGGLFRARVSVPGLPQARIAHGV